MKTRLVVLFALVSIFCNSCSVFKNFELIELEKTLLEPGKYYVDIYVSETFDVDDLTLEYSSAVKGKHQDILSTDGNDLGGILVLLFRSPSKQSQEYNFHSMMESQEGIIPIDYSNISDISTFFSTEYATHSVFLECEALVSISISRRGHDSEDAEIIWEMTQDIHDNVLEIVCK